MFRICDIINYTWKDIGFTLKQMFSLFIILKG